MSKCNRLLKIMAESKSTELVPASEDDIKFYNKLGLYGTTYERVEPEVPTIDVQYVKVDDVLYQINMISQTFTRVIHPEKVSLI